MVHYLVQMIRATGFPKISVHKLGGRVKLTGFTMDLKWSEIGNLHMTLIKVCKFILKFFDDDVTIVHIVNIKISTCDTVYILLVKVLYEP